MNWALLGGLQACQGAAAPLAARWAPTSISSYSQGMEKARKTSRRSAGSAFTWRRACCFSRVGRLLLVAPERVRLATCIEQVLPGAVAHIMRNASEELRAEGGVTNVEDLTTPAEPAIEAFDP